MKIYVAIVQRPMASLDETLVEIFTSRELADIWVDEQLKDVGYCCGYSQDEMNYDVIEKEVALCSC